MRGPNRAEASAPRVRDSDSSSHISARAVSVRRITSSSLTILPGTGLASTSSGGTDLLLGEAQQDVMVRVAHHLAGEGQQDLAVQLGPLGRDDNGLDAVPVTRPLS